MKKIHHSGRVKSSSDYFSYCYISSIPRSCKKPAESGLLFWILKLIIRISLSKSSLHEEQQPVRGTTSSSHACRTMDHSYKGEKEKGSICKVSDLVVVQLPSVFDRTSACDCYRECFIKMAASWKGILERIISKAVLKETSKGQDYTHASLFFRSSG